MSVVWMTIYILEAGGDAGGGLGLDTKSVHALYTLLYKIRTTIDHHCCVLNTMRSPGYSSSPLSSAVIKTFRGREVLVAFSSPL